MVQTGAVIRVADIHTGTLPHRFQTFEDFYTARIIIHDGYLRRDANLLMFHVKQF